MTRSISNPSRAFRDLACARGYDHKVIKAAIQLLKRSRSEDKPKGRKDSGDRFYLDRSTEYCDCCESVREPSRAWPWSEYKHAFTAPHVASLNNVSELALKRMKKALEALEKMPEGLRLKENRAEIERILKPLPVAEEEQMERVAA